MSFKSIFILSDDLSGAADCAARVSSLGLESIVVFGPETLAENLENCQVVSIDANSRYLSPEQAARLNRSLWEISCSKSDSGSTLFYKKVDSTLRGNFAAEMVGLKNAGVAIVAPAFISAGRTTSDGCVYVHGIPLEQTEVWKNEKIQGSGDLVAMLEKEGLRCVNLSLDIIRSDIQSELERLVSSGCIDAVICDAENESDLASIAIASIDLPVYWVGSAGLIGHLPKAAMIHAQPKTTQLPLKGPIITVVGSVSSISRTQANQLQKNTTVQTFSIPIEILMKGAEHPEWALIAERFDESLASGSDILVQTDEMIYDELFNESVITEKLAQLLSPWKSQVGGLVVTGGETARNLLPFFGIQGLRIVQELEDGVPLSIATGLLPIPVITKAGAFGSPDTLLNCYRKLAAMRCGEVSHH